MTKEEAIEKVREMKLSPGKDAELIIALHTLIPELRESEDERIIKTLQEYVKNRNWPLNGPTQDEVLAYLEKQKVIAAIPDELVECYKNICERGNRWVALLINAINGTNEQKEQKPADRFEEAREKYQVEWSDNDDQLIGFIFDLLNDLAWRKDWAMSKEECLERLKSIRPQPKQEWSEEDEKMRINILNALTPQLVYSVGKGTCTGTSTYKYDDEIKWLKSLRPVSKESLQSHWKPSEEQIHAIIEALKYLPNNKDEWMILNTLVDVFKKLM